MNESFLINLTNIFISIRQIKIDIKLTVLSVNAKEY